MHGLPIAAEVNSLAGGRGWKPRILSKESRLGRLQMNKATRVALPQSAFEVAMNVQSL